jgi:cell division protein FtsW
MGMKIEEISSSNMSLPNTPIKKPEISLIAAMFLLVTIGIIMLISTSSTVGEASYNDSYFFIKRQGAFIGIGVVAFFAGCIINYTYYQRHLMGGYLVGLIIMALTLIPGIGKWVGGASRWISIGSFSVQPVEMMKFLIVVGLANLLSNKGHHLRDFKTGISAVLALVIGPLMILFFQPDLGNLGLILMVICGILLISPIPFKHMFAVAGMAIMAVSISILTRSYQQDRILAFLNPEHDPTGSNYHMVQSLIAIGSGGLWGLGIGEGKLKYAYLPLQYSDFIFSIICEEGGIILPTLILVLFGVIIVQSLKIARYSHTLFGFYLAIGLMMVLVLQAILNMGVALGVFPVTGIPLTFISFGGSSLVMSMFCIGVLVNIARTSRSC